MKITQKYCVFDLGLHKEHKATTIILNFFSISRIKNLAANLAGSKIFFFAKKYIRRSMLNRTIMCNNKMKSWRVWICPF